MLKDFLAISVAAIVGANLRYLLSRLAALELGSVFPYGTLFINIVGSFIVGFFVIWTTERALVDPRWRLLVVIGLLRIVHHVFQLRLRNHGLLRAWPVGLDAGQHSQQQCALPRRGAGWYGRGASGVNPSGVNQY